MERVQVNRDAAGNFLGVTIDPGNFAFALLALNYLDGGTFAADKRSRYAGVMLLRDGDSAPGTDAVGGNPVPLPAPVVLLATGVVVAFTTRYRRATDAPANT